MQLKEIHNVKMKHFYKIPKEQHAEYSRVLSMLTPSDSLGRRKARNIFEMPYGEVERLRRAIETPEGQIEALSIIYDCDSRVLLDYRLTQFYPALNYIKKQFAYLDTIESTNLSKTPKRDMVDAGIHRLDRFGPLNVLDDLAKSYSKSPEEVEKWSYNLVYHLLWKRKVESDIQDDYHEITKKK